MKQDFYFIYYANKKILIISHKFLGGSSESLTSWDSFQTKRDFFGSAKFSSLKRSFSTRGSGERSDAGRQESPENMSLPDMDRGKKLRPEVQKADELQGPNANTPDLTPIVLNQVVRSCFLCKINSRNIL